MQSLIVLLTAATVSVRALEVLTSLLLSLSFTLHLHLSLTVSFTASIPFCTRVYLFLSSFSPHLFQPLFLFLSGSFFLAAQLPGRELLSLKR